MAIAKAYYVRSADVPAAWPVVEPLLRPAMQRCGEMKMEDLRSALAAGRFFLWVALVEGTLKAAAVTEVAETIAGRIVCIVACGGRDRAEWLPLLKLIEDYGREKGCARMRIYGRKGWARVLPGYRVTRVILEKELVDG
jgi:hypothetical protein